MKIDLGPGAWLELAVGTHAPLVSWPYGHQQCDSMESLAHTLALVYHDLAAECVPVRKIERMKLEEFNRGYRAGWADRGRNIYDASTETA